MEPLQTTGVGHPTKPAIVPTTAAPAATETHGTHGPLPTTAAAPFDPEVDARAIYDAAKGSKLTTDNKTLYAIIANRSPAELQAIRAAYRTHSGHELIDDIHDETKGDYQKLLTGLLTPADEFDAKTINKAIKGMTVDTQTLIDILPQRTPHETEAISAAYLRLYNTRLEDDLATKLKGNEEKFFISLIANKGLYHAPGATDDRSIEEAVALLYNAGQKRLGTDEQTFTNIITRGGTEFLQKVNYRYAQLHGDSLVTAADKELGGFYARALKALLTPHDEFYADVLYKAMSGMGTDDSRITNTIVTRRPRLPAINWVFVHKFGRSIRAMAEKECSGNYRKALSDVLASV